MAKQRVISSDFWQDDYVTELSPIEKLFFIYCFTNDRTELCGIYDISLKRIAFETGFKMENIISLFEKFSADRKIFYIDGYVYVRNFVKHQKKNPSIEAGIKRSMDSLPPQIVEKISSLEKYFTDCDRLGQTVPEGYTYTYTYTGTYTGTGTKTADADVVFGNEKKEENKIDINSMFEKFYFLYPLKKAKEPARKRFETVIKKNPEVFEKMLAGLKNQIESRKKVENRNKKFPKNQQVFIPNWRNPDTWINQKGWEDEVDRIPEEVKKEKFIDKDQEERDQGSEKRKKINEWTENLLKTLPLDLKEKRFNEVAEKLKKQLPIVTSSIVKAHLYKEFREEYKCPY